MTNPTSNFGWQMPTPTDLVTDLPADFEVFGQAVDTSMADLKGGTTGQILSKASNTDMDFTWIANDQGDITAVNVTSPITGGGTSGAVTVGIQSASTSQSGAVQLSDSTSTTSSVLASTPTATKAAYDLAAAAIPKSTVTGKGSIVTATASSTPANLSVGNNGEALIADSSTSTGLRYQGSTAGGRNFAINGGFDNWQRGTTFSTSGTYSVDRWYFTYGGTVTAAQETTVVQDGSTYSVKLTTGASSSFGELYNALEAQDVNFLAGKTITISAYVRASAAVSYTGSAVIGVQTNTTANSQTGGTWTEQGNASQAPSTSAWTRFSLTYAVPSGTKGLRVRLGNSSTQASGTILYWSNVQIEVGSVATNFSRAGGTIQGELAACQRYYTRYSATSINTYIGAGNAYSTTTGAPLISFPVEMRIAPTSIDTSGVFLTDDATNYSGGTTTLAAASTKNANIRYAHGSTTLTALRFYYLALTASTGYLGLSAEL